MRPVQIITDSCSDLPPTLQQEHNILVVPLAYIINGEAHPDDAWVDANSSDFFNRMRSGASPTTTQATAQTFIKQFSDVVQSGADVLYIGFSSALSGTLNAATLAKTNVMREHPEATIITIDSLCASLGQGLLVIEAARRLRQGANIVELSDWVENNKLCVNHWFTVGDLEYLRRGGRISNFASTVGSLLQVKPILRVDNGGHLVPFTKVRGRKKSLIELDKLCTDRIAGSDNQVIAISHGDCEAEAQELLTLIRTHLPVSECIMRAIGPVIGSHSGPETIALFFWGSGREAV